MKQMQRARWRLQGTHTARKGGFAEVRNSDGRHVHGLELDFRLFHSRRASIWYGFFITTLIPPESG
jgi:hypothetical protein